MRTFVFLLLALLASTGVYAIKDVQTVSLIGPAIVTNATLNVNGSRYVNPLPNPKTFWVESSYGLVKFSYSLPAGATGRPAGQQASVTVLVTYKVEENGTWRTKSTTTTLALDFKTATAADVSYFKVQGAQSLSVTVQSATVPVGWTILKLEAMVETESFSFLNVTDISTLQFASPLLTSDKNLRVSWTTVSAADHYELEWTYVSDQSQDDGRRLTPDSVPVDRFLFRNNSTRVDVSGLSYDIPMIYEPGLILYRVRGVGKNVVGSLPVLSKTAWTIPDGTLSMASGYVPSLSLYTFDGLEQNINWQSSLSFAEEGKNKVVISYHDGSSRNRQAVTRINSDQRSIVGETMYDYNGRPALQALPVPVTENKLSYYPNFNLVEGKIFMSKTDYDTAHAGQGCGPLSPSFGTNTGASQYYSSANPFGTNGNTGANLLNRNLIPDAQKFPYTQTYYTPDNTGRIAAQSGVGLTHRIGTGKETRYFYGSPQQPELTRLFGGQAGYAPHYKKNVVVDANGQASVSYMDMDGKVVATGLAGDSSGTLHGLGGNHARTISTNLIGTGISNPLTIDGLGKNYSSKFTVTGTNIPYNFEYKALVGKYDITCSRSQSSNPVNYSIDGAVDVDFLLQDKCGSALFDVVDSTRKGNIGSIQTVDIPKQITLQPGEYQITKTLKINEDKLDKYWLEYLAQPGTCVLTQDSFVNSELSKINTAGCGLTCSRCTFMVDSIINISPDLTTDQRDILRSTCDGICDDKDITCLSSFQAMLGDVSPGGQYGELRKNKINQPATASASFDENNNPVQNTPDITIASGGGTGYDAGDPADNLVDASPFPISVFNEQNRLLRPSFLNGASAGANWRHPLQVSSALFTGANWNNQVLFQNNASLNSGLTYAETDYKDRNGNVFYVNVYRVIDDAGHAYYVPAVTDTVLTLTLVQDAESGLYKIPVRYIQNLADFEKYWQSQWANFLVPYHPEFKYYLECTANHSSNAFDYALLQAETVLQAQAAGFLDVNGNPLLIGTTSGSSKDSLALSNNLYYLFQKSRNNNFKTNNSVIYTMAKLATITVGCPTMQSNCSNVNCQDGLLDQDEEWLVYRGFYLAEKNSFLRELGQQKAVPGMYYNGCIGHPDFLTTAPDAVYFRAIETVSTPASYESCSRHWYNPFNWGNVCQTVFYNAVQTFPYYLDPSELCFTGRASDYKDKTQRFFAAGPSGMGGGQSIERCSTLVDDGLGNIMQVSTPCDDAIQAGYQDAADEAHRFKFTSCGQCPVAADLEVFLMDLVSTDSLVHSQNMIVTCGLPQYHVQLEQAIRDALFVGISSPEAYWSSTLSLGNKLLTGQIAKGSTIYATISLRIPDAVAATFGNIEKICCLSVINAGTYFPTETGKNFTMHASFNGGTEFMVEGKINLALSPCTIAPKCLLSSDADHAVLLLNTLIPVCGTQKKNNLITGNWSEPLDSADNETFYNYPVKILAGKADRDAYNTYVEDISTLSPFWKSSVTPVGVLSGTFTYTDNGEVKNTLIEVSGLSSTQYSQVTEFINLRPEHVSLSGNDPCLTQPCEKQTFLADAVIVSGSQRTYATVTIYVPSLNPVICKPALPPSTQN